MAVGLCAQGYHRLFLSVGIDEDVGVYAFLGVEFVPSVHLGP